MPVTYVTRASDLPASICLFTLPVRELDLMLSNYPFLLYSFMSSSIRDMPGHTLDNGNGQLGYSDFTVPGKIKIKHRLGCDDDDNAHTV